MNEMNNDIIKIGEMIFFIDSPLARRAVSSDVLLNLCRRRKEEIRQEMGMAMGRMYGIWKRIYKRMFLISEVRAANFAISFKRVMSSTEMNPKVQSKNTFMYDLERYLQKIGMIHI